MKRLLAAALSMVLMGQTLFAQAADTTASQDKQLTAMVQTVKQQIDISNSYTKFYGEFSKHDLESQWQLHWTSDSENLDVAVKEDGTILNYNRSITEAPLPADKNYSPKFASATDAELQAAALKFVKKVLKYGETVVFQKDSNKIVPLQTDRQYLYGDLYFKGVRTPNSIYVCLDADDLSVLTYSRTETQCVSDIPSSTPSVQTADAGKKLSSTMKLRVQYSTLGSADGKASLLYMPQDSDEYYVDAQNGDLVNFTDLMRDLSEKRNETAAQDSASMGTAGKGLTDAEQLGVDLLKEVLSVDVLQQKMRAITELGLSDYTLSNSGYSVNQDTKDVSCFLDFSKQQDSKPIHKYITADAKTGKLLTLYTSRYWYANETKTSAQASAAQQQTAQNFLAKYYPDEYSKSVLLDTNPTGDTSVNLTYARQVNGYPFPEQYLQVSMNSKDGTIDSFSSVWDDTVKFEDAGTVVSAEKALQAYYAAHAIELSYKAVPYALDGSKYQNYQGLGYNFVYEWKLVYQAKLNSGVYGVNAADGTLRMAPVQNQTTLTYRDINAKTYPQIAKLAENGIGYPGGAFYPQKKLTQEAFLALLLSAQGELYDLSDAKSRELIYQRAYAYGMLTKEEYAPDKELTRAGMVKIMITATGYGRTADLADIYRCRFTDEAAIPRIYYGYVATAQGLGLIQGDQKGAFHPQNIATRAQAAILLYNFMSK